MGGLWDKIPITAKTFGAATLAIAGIPPLAGFFSKDEILGQAFAKHPALWVVGFITAAMTAFYMFRLLFLTFFGYSRADEHVEKHIHESPYTMTVPLMILAVLSVIGGWIGWPESLFGSNHFERFLEPVLAGAGAESPAGNAAAHGSLPEYFLMVLSVAVAVGGIWLAYQFYRTKRIAPELVAGKLPKLYELLVHKYYVDEIYDAAVVDRTKDLGTLLGRFDANVIDGVGVNGAGWLARFGSTLSMWWDKWIIDGLLNFSARLMQLLSYPVRLLQTGMFSSYAMLILVGLVVLLAYYGHHVQVLLRSVR
jgi:NADH-quinone oxidoreductase subunit L